MGISVFFSIHLKSIDAHICVWTFLLNSIQNLTLEIGYIGFNVTLYVRVIIKSLCNISGWAKIPGKLSKAKKILSHCV